MAKSVATLQAGGGMRGSFDQETGGVVASTRRSSPRMAVDVRKWVSWVLSDLLPSEPTIARMGDRGLILRPTFC